MKKFSYNLASVFLIALVAVACSSPAEQQVDVSSVTFRMLPSDIYKLDSVKKFMTTTYKENHIPAEEYLKKSNALLESDPGSAVYFLQRSITLEPTVEKYKTLSERLFLTGKYDESVECFIAYLSLGGKADNATICKAVKASFLGDRYGYYKQVLMAKASAENSGFNKQEIVSCILSDSLLKKELPAYLYKEAEQFCRTHTPSTDANGSGNIQNKAFSKYISEFGAVILPLVVDERELLNFDYGSRYEEYYEYMDEEGNEPEYFDYSPFIYELKMKRDYYFQRDEKYLLKNGPIYGVIYAGDTSRAGSPKHMRCVFHRVVTYNEKGNIIASKILGEHAGTKLRKYTVNPDMTIRVEEFQRNWKNPFEMSNIDNEVVSVEPVRVQIYKIHPDGSITEEKQ